MREIPNHLLLQVFWRRIFLREVATSLETELAKPFDLFRDLFLYGTKEQVDKIKGVDTDFILQLRAEGNKAVHNFSNAQFILVQDSLRQTGEFTAQDKSFVRKPKSQMWMAKSYFPLKN